MGHIIKTEYFNVSVKLVILKSNIFIVSCKKLCLLIIEHAHRKKH